MYFREDVINVYRSKQIEDHSQKLRQPYSNIQDCELLQFVIVFVLLKHQTFFYQVPYFINFYARVMLVDFISIKSSHGYLFERIIHVVWCEVSTEDFVHRLNQPDSPKLNLDTLRIWHFHRPRIKLCNV